jgi:methyl-accepting chemotaxis protein
MQIFNHLRIAPKILVSIAFMGALSLAIAGFGSIQLTRMARTNASLIDDQAESLKLAATANEKLARVHQLWLERLVETHTGNLGKLRAELAGEREELGQLLQELKPFMNGDDLAQFATIERGLADYDALVAPVESMIASGDRAGAEERTQDQGGDLYSRIDEAFTRLVARQDQDLDGGAKDAAAQARSTTWWLLAASIMGLIVVAGITLLVVRSTITGPLADMVARMGQLAQGNNAIDVPGTARADEIGDMAKAVLVFREAAVEKAQADAAKAIADAEQQQVVKSLEEGLGKLAQGDLTARINAEFSPSFVTVKTNFNDALAGLRDLIGSVTTSTETIRTGASEIAQASEDLARRTEANAASLEETSAAVSQMDGRLKGTAEAAGRTVARADGAILTVRGGRDTADHAMQAMNRVNESAKGIDSVIEGLDKIAFQTRVLAMNAAVEAGRAGEAGRGFAVVADLVSALAMRAEEEAGRARDQLTATQTDVIAAVEMVQKVDSALADISGDVSEVHTLLNQIASDNNAQSTAIGEISAAVGAMDQATQQNAAMVEQTSAAARNLSGEVIALSDQAGRFNVGGSADPAPRVRAPAWSAAPKNSGGAAFVPTRLPVAVMANGAPSSDGWESF